METLLMNENEKRLMIDKLEVENTMDLLYGLTVEASKAELLITILKTL